MFKMFNMLGIRLEPELEERFDSLAKRRAEARATTLVRPFGNTWKTAKIT